MAQVVSVRLSRTDTSPWGFRLQGGKDFGQPLLIQKVNGGSLAERAGLQVGDALIRVNSVDVQDLRHKDAQDTIVRAGNIMELQVQRGGASTWRPQVSPIGHVPTPGGRSPLTVTKTSLAAKPSSTPIPSGHNISPKPFGSSTPQMNGGDSVKAIVNKQYNTPVGMYSEETIAETLSAQAEVLAGGVLGVNFMKNEKTYDSQKSEVFKMVQEVEKEPREPEPEHTSTFQPSTPITTSINPSIPISGLRHVSPPEAKPPTSPQASLPPGQNICADCERLIVGVFVRIKDKNLHVECFKCATCGTSLKNVGYYNINNKLYCDIHAKMVARQNPPAPNLDPITVPPGGRLPSGTFTTPSITTNFPSSLSSAAPQSPQPGTIAPMPFHTTNAPGPKPFGQTTAPAAPTSVPFNAPPAPISNISIPKPQTEAMQPIIWPPTKVSETKDTPIKKDKVEIQEPPKSEPIIPILNIEDVDEAFDKKKKMSLCSEEISHISDKKIEKYGISSIYESAEDPNRPPSPVPPSPEKEASFSLVNEINKAKAKSRCEERREISSSQTYEQQSFSKTQMTTREEAYTTTSKSLQTSESMTVGGLRRSVSPEILDISTKPHEVRSLLPPASAVRPLSPLQRVVFPPEIPEAMRSPSSTPHPPAVTELVVSYCASPQPQLTESKITKKMTKEEHAHSKKKKSQLTKEDKLTVSETQSSRKEKKLTEQNKEENVQSHEKKESCEKESVKPRVEEKMYTKSEVDKMVQEEVKKVLMTCEKSEKSVKMESKATTISDLPAPIIESGEMASALMVAPERPFTPVPFPKPLEIPSVAQLPKQKLKPPVSNQPVPLPPYSKPYFPPPPPPPEHEKTDDSVARAMREVGCRSPMTEALTIAPDRPYSPLPSLTAVEPSSTGDKSAFKPVADKNKKQMSMLSALTVAPTVPFTLPGKTPIPTEPKIEIAPSAFKPLNGSVSGVIPKTAPLNKELPLPYIPHPKIDSKSGVDRSVTEAPGMKKEVIKGFESTTAESDTSKYSHKAEFISVSSKTESKTCKESQKEQPRPITPKQPKPASGLRGPNLLPYYQQNIGEIPVRNRSISPVPHPIKAPSMTPPPSPKSPAIVPRSTVKTSSLALQQRQQAYDRSREQRCVSSTYSQKSMLSSESTATTKTITNINKTKQVFKPAQPPRQLSPHWRGDYVRAVQNLSPITVRLPSPTPRPTKPVGETSQEAGAKILIKKSKRGQSPLVTYEPETKSSSSAKCTSEKGCSSSKGCSDGKSCSDGKGCSNGKGCSDGKGCSENGGGKMSEGSRKSGSSHPVSTSDSRHQQSSLHKSSQQQYQSRQLQQNETVYQSQQKIVEQRQQMQHYEEQQIQSHKYDTSSNSLKDKSLEFSSKANTSIAKSEIGGISYGHDDKAQNKDRFDYLSSSQKYMAGKCETQYSIPSSTARSKIPKSYQPNSSTLSSGLCDVNPSSSGGNAGGGGMPGSGRTGTVAGSSAPRRGRGILNTSVPPGGRIPLCGHCNSQIRGPFITALGKIWCPDHFVCVNAKCRRPLQDIGFVEEADGLYCEFCFEQYLAPSCDKCNAKIKGDCLNAIGKHFHPECFRCAYCEKMFGNNPFFLEDALPYCEADWNELFTTKCFSCGFPIEAGDRWVEALSNNYHSQCFNCTMCKKNLEGQSFYAKGGRPYCKNHAR